MALRNTTTWWKYSLRDYVLAFQARFGRKIQTVPMAPAAIDSSSKIQVTISLKGDMTFLCRARSADSGMTAQIMKTENEPRRPAVPVSRDAEVY